MTDWTTGRIVIHEPPVASDNVGDTAYVRAVLRDDQLELIRQIVREEIEKAKG